jgi:hypothetical protein
LLRKIFLILVVFTFSNAIAAELDLGNNDGKLIGVTSLMSAAADGDIQGVKFFTRTDTASINKRNFGGATALHLAARAGNFEICDILIKAGAKSDFVDNEGWTPLMRAALKGNQDLVKLFMNNGANAMQKNSIGESAIIQAVNAKCAECLKAIFLSPTFLKDVDDRILKQQLSDAYKIAQQHEDKESEDVLTTYLGSLAKTRFAENTVAKVESVKPAMISESEIPQPQKQSDVVLTPIVATSTPVLLHESDAPVIFPRVDKKFKFKKSEKEQEVVPTAMVSEPVIAKNPEVPAPKKPTKFKLLQGEAAKEMPNPQPIVPVKVEAPVAVLAPVFVDPKAPTVEAPASAPAVIATISATQIAVEKSEEKQTAKRFIYKKVKDSSAEKTVVKEEVSLAKPSKKLAKIIAKPVPTENEKKKVFSFKTGKEKTPTVVEGIPMQDLPPISRTALVKEAAPEEITEEVVDLKSDKAIKPAAEEIKSGKKFIFKAPSK